MKPDVCESRLSTGLPLCSDVRACSCPPSSSFVPGTWVAPAHVTLITDLYDRDCYFL